MKKQKNNMQDETSGGLETLSGKERLQFFVAISMVILAMLAFLIKIYFL